MNFKIPGGTSRGILHTKETYFLVLSSGAETGVGECGLFRGLSFDDRPDYEEKLAWLCEHIHWDLPKLLHELIKFPSIQFGLEQAFLSLKSKNVFEAKNSFKIRIFEIHFDWVAENVPNPSVEGHFFDINFCTPLTLYWTDEGSEYRNGRPRRFVVRHGKKNRLRRNIMGK